VLLLGACLAAASTVETAKKFSDWSAPVNLGTAVNTPFNEVLPHLSKSGLSLYYASDRPDGFGGTDIWVAQRSTPDEAWSTPANLGPLVNTPGNDRAPALSRDGHFLFFGSDREGGFGLLDVWVSKRDDVHDDLAWQAPVNLGAGVNGASNDFGPGFLENDDIGLPILFFGSNRPQGAGGFDIYVSGLLANGWFGPAVLVTELSTPFADFRPSLSSNGLELVFDSNRPAPAGVAGLGLRDLWTSSRQLVSSPWAPPTNLGPIVNSPADDAFPALSADGTTLIFVSNRSNGAGGSDLYWSKRE
jgi:hypothetical protein